MIPLSHRETSCSYATTHALEPVDVKSLDEPQSSMYKPSEEQKSVITLECPQSASLSQSVHGHSNNHSEIKLESLEHSVDQGSVPVGVPVASTGVPTGVPTSVVTAVSADTWTPLTPPQSTLQ